MFAPALSLVDATCSAELRGGEAVDSTMIPPKTMVMDLSL